ncbi:MAG: GNAT family N-acetyltransferase [Anaerofustis sp.]
MDIILRNETEADWRAVEELTREAFWNVYVPGCCEHYLAHVMRESELFIPELDFVAEADGKIVGNIMYAHSMVAEGDDKIYPVITFGPVSVLPAYQKQGVGSRLIRHTLDLAKKMGYPAVFIYGDPAYYSRFGFVPAETYRIKNASGKYADALQVLELEKGAMEDISGRFCEGAIYDIDEKEAEAFDAQFPPKEKGYLPSQDRFMEMVQSVHSL